VTASAAELEQLRHRPLVFVDDLELIELDDGDRSHLERSLRVRTGEAITVSDGAGRWRAARLGPQVEADGEIVVGERPTPSLTVGFAPVKGDRSDLVVQKLTELGVDNIVPITTERSVVRWDEKRIAKNVERHRRIAREAAMQSRTVWLPSVAPCTDLSAFVAERSDAVLADPSGTRSGAAITTTTSTVAIGPEGGFAPGELDGRARISLPGRILRTETAAIAAAVLLADSRERAAQSG
jgi:16S rRNA (uracil1498-N3)-methyltransferase